MTSFLRRLGRAFLFQGFDEEPSVHDPVKDQRRELLQQRCRAEALAGLDCDELPGSTGPFGRSVDNPIPVNGVHGTLRYLGKLLHPNGCVSFFHRLGSIERPSLPNVDVYELVDERGEYWDVLFVDIYHPRRSNRAPDGYTFLPHGSLEPYHKGTNDTRFVFGVNFFTPRFPYDVPESIASAYEFSSLADLARAHLGQTRFERPPGHRGLVAEVASILSGRSALVDGNIQAVNPRGPLPSASPNQSRQSLERRPAWVYSGDCRTATAILDTNCGSIHVRFFYDKAPHHVQRFLDLAGSGFYEGTLFHRVIPGFMIQGGDPLTRDPANAADYGRGGLVDEHGSSLCVPAEVNDISHKRGTLSMARASDPDSASSQFFIVVADSPFLDGQYTAFGEVTLGMDVVDRIVAKSDADTSDERTGGKPRVYQKLNRVSIFS